MTYHVTELDILYGCPFEPSLCPVARAIKRRHPGAGVLVHSHDVSIGQRYKRLPDRVKNWIRDYDAIKDVNPIRFEL